MDSLLEGFLLAQGWLADPRIRMAFELDLVARPYVYREAVSAPSVPLSHLRILSQERYQLVLELPSDAVEILTSFEAVQDIPDVDPARLRVNHMGRRKMPYPRQRSLDHNAAYCQAMMNRLRDILPSWAPVVPDAIARATSAS
jgi:putative methyltransferase